MRTEGQIHHKLQQAQYRHLKKELSRLLRRSPGNCVFNRQTLLPLGKVGVCSKDCQTCDPVINDRSVECPLYELAHDKDALKESLTTFFRERTVPEIAIRFPDVAALLWVLVGEDSAQRGALISDAIPVTTLYGIPLWVDTQAEVLELERICSEREVVLNDAGAATHLAGCPDGGLSRWVLQAKEDLEKLRKEVAQHISEKEALEAERVRLVNEGISLQVAQKEAVVKVTQLEGQVAELNKPFWKKL